MKVLVVNNMAPFVWGGAEELAEHLRRNLLAHGHEAEVLRLPFQWEPAERIPSQMLLARTLELSNVDRVIALKFPAYLVRHPHKTLWLLHQYRQAYDLYDAGHSNLPVGAPGDAIRNLILAADDETFVESRKIFVNSSVTAGRLLRYNGFLSEVLYPPVNDPELFVGGGQGDYLFVGGRVNALKRQSLVVEALARCPPTVRAVIAGPPDSEHDAVQLEREVERHGLADRVRLDLRMLPRETYAAYVKDAAAVVYAPYDEDSLGYVAMEAATAGKPIITSSDSGGILGLVTDGASGWVAEPQPDSLAHALSEAMNDSREAALRGAAARDVMAGLGIDWPSTIMRLLE